MRLNVNPLNQYQQRTLQRFYRSKFLHSDALIIGIRKILSPLQETRKESEYSLIDVCMLALAMFMLKEPSLLSFHRKAGEEELKKSLQNTFKIMSVPGQSQIRELLDDINPEEIRSVFTFLFGQISSRGILNDFKYMDGYYLISIDGTGYFTSKTVHCENCLKKVNKKTGKITYYHQMLCAAIIHPDKKQVIPLPPEEIVNQDGDTKNDCERNAAARFVEKFRKDHPHLKVIMIEDGLSSNAPHINLLIDNKIPYILVAKPGDHKYMYRLIQERIERNEAEVHVEIIDGEKHFFLYTNQISLNESNQDVLVNYLDYWIEDGSGKELYRNSWVTDFILSQENILKIAIAGRARWHIENETINTLKTQGYNFGHNYGHGDNNLSLNFSLLMMIAFFIDQTQELVNNLFNAILDRLGNSKTALWDWLRTAFKWVEVDSYEDALLKIAGKLRMPIFQNSS